MLSKYDLLDYDTIIVAYSGGKDSTACLLHLLDQGVPIKKIEIWHHLVDGWEGSTLMDWPCTKSYVQNFANYFGFYHQLFYSWKQGGFEREMLRQNSRTAPIAFETPQGVFTAGGKRGKISTRRKFPQVSGDLGVRWCTSYLKIDVCSAAITNQPRFLGKKTLVISGERREESPLRARYKEFERDRSDNRNGKRVARHVDRWRPVIDWKEAKVWGILKNHGVNPHPAYRLGWSRLSCMTCIFGSCNQWASVKEIDPLRFDAIWQYETEFACTIKRSEDIFTFADRGNPYSYNPYIAESALSTEYNEPIVVMNWKLPAGAFGENAGPY